MEFDLAFPPHAVLSEYFQERMQGKRLRSAVFLTYQFEPGFFEQEVLPVFVDIALSHAVVIRLLQIEDLLRDLPGSVAVYYDANGIVTSDLGSAKLDVQRIPVQHRKGVFHPKNVFLLVEDAEPDEHDNRSQSLIIASLSANLTRSGWWENIEACHVEEIGFGERTRLKDDTVKLLKELSRKTPAQRDHTALNKILNFLKSTDQLVRKSEDGKLKTHLYATGESLADFLEKTAGQYIHGAYLEIISPFLDDAKECRPLIELVERFQPKAVRIYLPKSRTGEANCKRELFESVREMPGVYWGKFPRDFIRLGRSDEAGERFVHAKLYRFFTQNPKREITFIGSANLTTAAHQTGGNFETGFLVDSIPPRRPEFWLDLHDSEPSEFVVQTEDSLATVSGGTRLNLRYHWNLNQAEAFWDAPGDSPELRLEASGIVIGIIPPLPSRSQEWVKLTDEISTQIGERLNETSLFEVHGEASEPTQLLVQEAGMSHKPTLLSQLSISDILRYWSLLTAEQRAAFIEARASELLTTGQGADLVARSKFVLANDTVFDKFAGFFHAFESVERAVRNALDDQNTKQADYRLFGKKYDSLGTLLDRIGSKGSIGDDVDRYVIMMCARQLCQEIARDFSDYWKSHKSDTRSLTNRFEQLGAIRKQLVKQNADGFGDFLDWFDNWFLRRAKPVSGEQNHD